MTLTITIISTLAVAAMLVYIAVFFVRYRCIPQSLSVTAEYPHQYYFWQATVCSVMGWLQFFYPAMYYSDHGLLTLLASAGTAGLGLAGYYSYNPQEETRRDLVIHKAGSFSGATLLMLFYLLAFHWYWVLIPLAVAVILGLTIKGCRHAVLEKDHSIVFWAELAIIGIVSYHILTLWA